MPEAAYPSLQRPSLTHYARVPVHRWLTLLRHCFGISECFLVQERDIRTLHAPLPAPISPLLRRRGEREVSSSGASTAFVIGELEWQVRDARDKVACVFTGVGVCGEEGGR